jgi:hypothetical protein
MDGFLLIEGKGGGGEQDIGRTFRLRTWSLRSRFKGGSRQLAHVASGSDLFAAAYLS